MKPVTDDGNGRRTGARAWALALSLSFGFVGAFSYSLAPAVAQTPGSQARPAQSKPPAAKKKPKAPQTSAQRAAAPAPQKPGPKGFVETIMEGPRLTTTPPQAADWVRASRPDPNAPRQAARPPGQGRPVLTADEIRKREAALDSARARHDRAAGRKPPSGKFGSVAGKPEQAEADKHKAGCVLTCSTPISVSRTQRR